MWPAPPLSDASGNGRAEEIIGRLERLMDRSLFEMQRMTAPEAKYSAMTAAWMRSFLQKIKG